MAGGQPLRRRDERALSDRQYLHLRRCAAYREGDAAICAVTRTDQMKPHAWFVSGGGAWPRLTVPLFRPPLSRSLSPSSIVGRLKPMRLLVVVSLQMGIAESGEDEAKWQRDYQERVALEGFGNHELPHIHAAVEELTEGVGAGQRYATRA